MIDRYTLPEMGRVWSEAHKYELWCQVETLVLEANARAGTVPADAVGPVRAAPPPTPEAVAEIEAVTEHDVIAFLSAWADNTEPRSAAAYVHYGMTSSDLLDTALALQLTEASDIILAKADRLVAALRDHGLEHRGTLRSGRTHGIHAEPDLWGHRVADFAFAAARVPGPGPAGPRSGGRGHAVRAGRQLLQHRPVDRGGGDARARPAPGRRRHPGGDPRRHRRVGVRPGRAGHGLRGGRARGQARPADRGPRAGRAVPDRAEGLVGDAAQEEPDPLERICGLARVVRSYVTPVTEGIPLWHERDISHSSVERIALPDAAIATDYTLHLTVGLVDGLTVDAARMRANMDITHGLLYSSSVLLELVSSGLSREDAYTLVQSAAMETWDTQLALP